LIIDKVRSIAIIKLQSLLLVLKGAHYTDL
jgi:hypothetical protein